MDKMIKGVTFFHLPLYHKQFPFFSIYAPDKECPPVYDGFSCWGPTSAGTTVSMSCPLLKGSDVRSKF